MIFNGKNVWQTGAAGSASCERLVKGLLIAEVLDRDLHVGELLVEAGDGGLQRRGGYVPAPDRDFAGLRKGRARAQGKHERGAGHCNAH